MTPSRTRTVMDEDVLALDARRAVTAEPKYTKMLGLFWASRALLLIDPTINEWTKPDEDLTPSRVTIGDEVETNREGVMAAAKPACLAGRNERRVPGTIPL